MIRALSIISLAMFMAGCGGGGGGSTTPQTGQFSLGISDAPVEQADEVVLFFNEVILVPEAGGDPIVIDLSDGGPDRVDLLRYTGSDSATLINSQTLPVGQYTMCLYVLDGNGSEQLSYVNTEDQGVVPLRVNSKGSCQGVQGNTQAAGRIFFNRPFTINTGINSFVAEFNLRQGLVDPRGQEGMFIKPTAVQLVNEAGAGNITGVLMDAQREACVADMTSQLEVSEFSHVAYLFAGDRQSDTMGDLVGEGGYPDGSSLVAPVATADINLDETSGEHRYEFGFIGEGIYSIGYSCVANFDLPESHETEEQDFTFYQHYGPVQVQPGGTTTQELD